MNDRVRFRDLRRLMSGIELLFANALIYCQSALFGLMSWARTHREENPMVILLLRTSALGDFLFSVPAMVALRKHFPAARIVLLTATTTSPTQRAAVQAYSGVGSLPWVSFMVPAVITEVICIHSFSLNTLWSVVREEVRELNPDATVILAHPGEPGMGLFKKLVFLRFLGVKSKIYGWRTRGSIKWFRKAQYESGLFDHHVIGPLRSIAELPGMPGVGEMEIAFPLCLEPNARSWAEDLWQKHSWIGGRVVAVAPGSVQPHKRWPIERFVALCQKLVQDHKVSIVVIGTASDTSLGAHLAAVVDGDVLNLTGGTTLSQSAALLERCTLLIGNDGGAMHLGSAMSCPAVSIVPGIEYPGSIEPWFSPDLAVRHPVSCAPCYSFTRCPQGHNKCMTELPVHDVYERCRRILGQETSGTVA